jgi:hypothetical protein
MTFSLEEMIPTKFLFSSRLVKGRLSCWVELGSTLEYIDYHHRRQQASS